MECVFPYPRPYHTLTAPPHSRRIVLTRVRLLLTSGIGRSRQRDKRGGRRGEGCAAAVDLDFEGADIDGEDGGRFGRDVLGHSFA